MTKRNLKKVWSKSDHSKQNKTYEIPGILGFTISGKNVVEVPNRPGFVYVRLRHDLNEVVQVYNDKVSPVYNLPVTITKDLVDNRKYVIVGRDLGIYSTWNSTYIPRHGNQHSFNPESGGGGDTVFVYSRQIMPLLGRPSGTSGSMNLYIEPYNFYNGSNWIFAGGTGTSSFDAYKPTGTSARMVLVYVDANGNPQLSAGSTFFSANITGSAAILPYVPNPPASTIPVCAIRLVSGTSIIAWGNIYDLRPFLLF